MPVFAPAQYSLRQDYYIDTINRCLSLPFENCWKIIDNSVVELTDHRLCSWVSPSVTFICKNKEAVKSCTDGKVISIFNVEGSYGIIVKYGDYFFCYGSLSAVKVKKGEIVNERQILGLPDNSDHEDNAFQIDIMIMKETKYVKPASWLNIYNGNKEIL